MDNLKNDLSTLEFQKKGNIIITADRQHPIFELFNPLETNCGIVYIWVVEENGEPTQIIYIGKAGSTLLQRCRQHTNGFKGGHTRGLKNGNTILALLNKGTILSIYARYSDTMEMFGQEVSLCECEEKALIKKFKDNHKLLNVL